MALTESLNHVLPKSKTHASVVSFPTHLKRVIGWISPQEVSHHAWIRDLLWSLYFGVDYTHTFVAYFWWQAPVHAKNSFVYNRAQRQIIEHLTKCPEKWQWVPPFDLVVKPVNLGDLSALVVPSNKVNVLRIFYFVRKQQANHLNTILSPINEVPNH